MKLINSSLLFLCLIGYAATAQKKLSFSLASPHQIALTAPKATLDIPVTLMPDSSEPKVRTQSIYFQDLTPIAASTMQSTILKDSENNLLLHLDINNNPSLPAGKYNLIIEETKVSKGKTAPVTYPLEITVKAASLENPIPVVSQIEGSKVSPQSLLLYNKSFSSYLFPITIEKISLTGPDKTPLTQDINFKTKNVQAPPDQETKIAFDYSDKDIPIGKSVGSFRINAPQLLQPIPFTLEITKKRGEWLIFLMIFLGLLIGFITKDLLTRKKALNSSINAALELIQKLQTEKKNKPDQEYIAQINGLIQRLGDALPGKYGWKDKAEIDTAISEAEKALAEFNTALLGNIQRIQTELNSMHKAVLPLGLFLPKGITTIAQQATAQIDSILQLTVNNRYTDAKEQFNTLKNNLVVDLKKEVDQFKEFYLRVFTDIKNAQFVLSGLPMPISDVPDQIIVSINELDVDISIQEPDKARTLLESINTVNSKIKDFILNLSTGINTLLSTLSKIISQVNPSIQADIDSKKNELTTALTVGNKPIEDVMISLSVKLNELHQWLLAKMTTDTPLTKDQTDEIKKDLREGKYIDAANALVSFTTIAARGASLTANITPAEIHAATLEYNNTNFISSLLTSTPPAPPQTKTLITNDNTIELMATSKRRIFLIDVLQTIFIGIGIMAVGYFIYIDKYTGTNRELFEIFIYAYMLNITTETLATQFGVLPKIPRA